MPHEEDVLYVALEVGKKIMLGAKGDPARTLAYGVAAAVAVTGITIGYGSYVYGNKVADWLKE